MSGTSRSSNATSGWEARICASPSSRSTPVATTATRAPGSGSRRALRGKSEPGDHEHPNTHDLQKALRSRRAMSTRRGTVALSVGQPPRNGCRGEGRRQALLVQLRNSSSRCHVILPRAKPSNSRSIPKATQEAVGADRPRTPSAAEGAPHRTHASPSPTSSMARYGFREVQRGDCRRSSARRLTSSCEASALHVAGTRATGPAKSAQGCCGSEASDSLVWSRLRTFSA